MIKKMMFFILVLSVFLVGCDDPYDTEKGLHSNGDNAIYLNTE